MAIQPTATWRIRVAGNELNGGGYDAAISSAGTDYTDQDSSQLSLSDIVTTGGTTVTSVTGGFTSAMIGNCLRIAGDGYYFITARASTNSITVDRATGTGSGQSGRVGGAWASLTSMFVGGSLTQPLLTSPVKPGNTVFLRGSGSNTPSSPDYTFNPANYALMDAGDATNGRIRIIGYNGRPLISYGGLLAYNATNFTVENVCLILDASASTYIAYGFFNNGGSHTLFRNCQADINGLADAVGLYAVSIFGCKATNSGTTSALGSGYGLAVAQYGGRVSGCRVEKQRGGGIRTANSAICSVDDNLVINNGKVGVFVDNNTGSYGSSVVGNTIDSNGSDGITFQSPADILDISILNNNITNNGGYGINVPSGTTTANDAIKGTMDYNVFHSNSSGNYNNVSAGPNDQSADPQYTNSAGGDYTPTNASLLGTAFPTSIP